jgi:hypothetical protein
VRISASGDIQIRTRETPEGVAISFPITIRQWAREGCCGDWADAGLAESHDKTLRELQTGWLSALRLSRATLIDAMTGRLDDLPNARAGRLKAAEVTLRMIAQPEVLAIVPELDLTEEALAMLTPREQYRHKREEVVRDKSQRWANRSRKVAPIEPCRSGSDFALLLTTGARGDSVITPVETAVVNL